MKLNPNQTCY